MEEHIWLVVSIPLKNISQIGPSSQLLGKIKNVPNHQPDIYSKSQPMPWTFQALPLKHRTKRSAVRGSVRYGTCGQKLPSGLTLMDLT